VLPATHTHPAQAAAQDLHGRDLRAPRPAAGAVRRSQRDLIIASLIACPSPRPEGEGLRARG
jgi:hypothetical protein